MKHFINNKGFSLIELMVAAAITGLVAIIAVPSYISYLPQIKLKSAVSEVASDLRWARGRSVATNNNYQVIFDAANRSYEINNVSTGATEKSVSFADRGYYGIEFAYAADVEGPPPSGSDTPDDPITFPDDTVTFTPNGSVTIANAANYSVYLKNSKGKTYGISVSWISGLSKVYRWTGTEWQ